MAKRQNIDDILEKMEEETTLEEQDLQEIDSVLDEIEIEENEEIDVLGNDDTITIDTQEDPEAQLFEDGPTIAQVNEWKEKYGDVFVTADGLDMYIWRCLTRGEYKTLMTTQESLYDREENYCNICVIWPENIDFKSDNIKAGIPSVLAEQILIKSGFQADYASIQI